MNFFIGLIVIIGFIGATLGNPVHEHSSKPVKKKDIKALIKKIEGPTGNGKLSEKEILAFFEKALEDGKVTKDEFTAAFDGVNTNVVEVLFHELDDDHNDEITKEEIIKNFHEFDLNGGGKVNAKELTKALQLGQIYEILAGDDHQLTLDELKKAFDLDGKTEIKKKELIKHLKNTTLAGFPKKLIKKIVKEFDDDHDKVITVQEVETNFKAFNSDNNDHLSIEEFRSAIVHGPLGQIFYKIDADHDGSVTLDEIKAFFKVGADGITKEAFAEVLKDFPKDVVDDIFDQLNDDDTDQIITNQELESNFKAFDSNGDGKLSVHEFINAIDGGAIRQIFNKLDKDGDGEFELEEIEKFLTEFDADGNKELSKEEFNKAFEGVPQKYIDALFKEFDDNGDGQITIDEIKKNFADFDVNFNGELSFKEFKAGFVIGQIFHKIDKDGNGKVTLDEIKELFDTDKDGNITKKEFKEALKGFPKKIVKKIFKEFDDDKSGIIETQELENNFKAFDIDGDGSLTVDEFRSAILYGALGQIFNKIDKDHDGAITEEELVGFFQPFDKDNNGLDKKEFKEALKGYPKKAVKKLFKELNDDDDKVVTIEELKNNFKAFDSNGDGKITFREFLVGIKKGPIGQIYNKFDTNGDGELIFEEIKDHLKKFDENNDERISIEEFNKALPGVPEKVVKRVFKKLATTIDLEKLKAVFDEIDHNKNGEISLKEFKKYIKHSGESSSSEED